MEHRDQTVSQRFKGYQPGKMGLLWACAGSAVVAVVVGFSWGGWVTGGSARDMAENSAAQARQELTAAVCVDRFTAAPDAGVQLTTLNELTSSYARGKFIQEGGWAVLVPAGNGAEASMPARSSTDDRKAAALCAAALEKLEVPAAESVTLAQ